jgi:hypothetical protein
MLAQNRFRTVLICDPGGCMFYTQTPPLGCLCIPQQRVNLLTVTYQHRFQLLVAAQSRQSGGHRY